MCLFVSRRFACVFYSIPLLVCCACLCPECWSTVNAITHREWSWRWCIRTATVKQHAVFYLCVCSSTRRKVKKKKRPFISVTTLLDVSGRNSHRAVDEQLYLFQSIVLSRQSTAVPVTPVALLSVAAVRTAVHSFFFVPWESAANRCGALLSRFFRSL